MERIESELPSETKSSAETDEPNRAADRKLKADPSDEESNTDTVAPNLAKLRTDSVEPM
jgi:hypothetical protein